ncbi:cupin domain-containing protein [Aquimarina sp. ERC-38]|uniref:cupin domain-containing protein n=1 Tax=Aquimarina sp. ERC-38 TaxID=2949996 RepID=UPI002247D6E4|nr:cupin domain-containing protein [Aquimarina sp. ERC-38]UZO80511.1 cupin domain-containing protein [Aquimarina sp. ERC-38]
MTKKFLVQKKPFVVPTTDHKVIEEHFGIATDQNKDISIARMIAPPQWSEPFQKPAFDEYTYVIRGQMQCLIDQETILVQAGESIKVTRDVRVQYSNPSDDECEYIAICTPAFDINLANREV